MSDIDSFEIKRTLFMDVGNSSIKGAFYKDDEWVNLHPKGVTSAADFIEWIKVRSKSFDSILIASVRVDITSALKDALSMFEIKMITIHDVPDYKIDYKTPKTLGVDRYLGCLGAIQHTSKGVVVIDGGSACTLDYMAADGVYHGGVIMPGLNLILNVFREKAPELPLVELGIPKEWPGKSTQESLQWGQAGVFRDGIKAILTRYREHFGDFDLYLTGGDAKDISSLIDEEHIVRPNLVFDGMKVLISSH